MSASVQQEREIRFTMQNQEFGNDQNFFEMPMPPVVPGVARVKTTSRRKTQTAKIVADKPAIESTPANHEIVTTVTKGQANEIISNAVFGLILLINFWLFNQFGPVAGTSSVLSMAFLLVWKAIR